jgi:hypothetical protein
MPWADNFFAPQPAVAKWRPIMGADILNGTVLTIHIAQHNLHPIQINLLLLTGRDLTDLCRFDPLCHLSHVSHNE